MKNEPKLNHYTISINQIPVAVTGYDIGPVAHFRAAADSPDGFDSQDFLDAFADTFLRKINKPCLVETPSQSILLWREGSEMGASWGLEIEPVDEQDDSDDTGDWKQSRR